MKNVCALLLGGLFFVVVSTPVAQSRDGESLDRNHSIGFRPYTDVLTLRLTFDGSTASNNVVRSMSGEPKHVDRLKLDAKVRSYELGTGHPLLTHSDFSAPGLYFNRRGHDFVKRAYVEYRFSERRALSFVKSDIGKGLVFEQVLRQDGLKLWVGAFRDTSGLEKATLLGVYARVPFE